MAIQKALLVLVVFGICQSTRAAVRSRVSYKSMKSLDVDECLENNGGCNPGETCVNTPGRVTCAYMNGKSTLPGYVCFDINECLTNYGGCSDDAVCENTPGSFTCTCNVGYAGDGFNCSDIDECLINNGGCSKDATCTNTPGSFTCSCNRGFSGDGFTCADNDECESNNGGCSSLATCYNTEGSFTCTCNIGYYGNGFTCLDYNECLSNNGGCSRYATCTNTIGSFECACKPGYTGDGFECTVLDLPRDCADILKKGGTESGEYEVFIGSNYRALTVYCDMTTDDGGWLVIQRRQDGSENFLRNWDDYAQGFGDLSGEFWLGNEHINIITTSQRYKLRVDLQQFNNNTGYSEFDHFRVESAADKYRLSVIGSFSGTAGNSLTRHLGMQFTTVDNDNDNDPIGCCAVYHKGAWWYNYCYMTNLNGIYYQTNKNVDTSVNWRTWTTYDSLKRTEMKIKPFF